jgi:hypothetical protein
MTMLLALGAIVLAGYFFWVVVTALIRGRTPDFGRDVYRGEQPAKYWVQIVLYSWMALGLTIYALVQIGDS